jgi:hypothetical protein
VMRLSHEVRNSVNAGADIGLNWQIMKYGNTRIIAHGGATQGFRTFLAFDPDKRVGGVVLANYPVSGPDLLLHLINPNIPLAGAAVAERTEVDVAEDVLRQYVGDYEVRPTFAINVTMENGKLFAQATGQNKLPIFPESQSKFFYRVVNAQLSFTRDSAGKVAGLVLHQNGREQPARRRLVVGVPLATGAELAAALPGRKVSIPSRLLGGERALRIVTPAGYELSQSTRYPVLYVVESEKPVHSAGAIAAALARSQSAPDMIVVHVAGVPSAAERASYAKFLSDELRPWVEREYRTAPLGILVGGADVLAATTAFAAEIAMAADNSAQATFKGQQQPATASPEPHAALNESLKWIFAGWTLPDIGKVATQPGGVGLPVIDAHFARLSERFGYKVVPHEDVLDNAGIYFIQQRKYDDAVRLWEKNRELHPGSARTWNHLGDAYRSLCRRPESKEHYTKAHDLAQAMGYANVSNYSMELGRITQEIETNAPCTPVGTKRPSVAIAPAILRSYVGEYQFSPRMTVLVTMEGDTLYAQPTGEATRRIGGITETRFFVEDSSIEFTFLKDASGAVTGMTLHQGGREMPGRKVK